MARGARPDLSAPVQGRVLLAALLLLVLPAHAGAQEGFEAVATGLAFPTNVAFAPDGRVFFTEKETGNIRILEDGRVIEEPFATLPVDARVNEVGLLGIALHPVFPDGPWVYAYYSDPTLGLNRLVRIRAAGNEGAEIEPLLDLLPTVNGWHNGGDMTFGPDGMLYLAVGEGHEAERAQDAADLGGKILRIAPDGSIPADNPLGPASYSYAIGIRNSFGLCFDPATGDLWETENGPTSHDEVNRIVGGANYGWPRQLGPGGDPPFVDPVLDFPEEIVPTGCAVSADGSGLYFGDARGALHRADLPDPAEDDVVALFDGIVTDVARAPDGAIWVVTADAIYRSAGEPSGAPAPGTGSRTGPVIWTGAVVAAALVLLLLLVGRRPRRR